MSFERGLMGICEAVARPHMNYVSIKTVAQQDLLAIHNDRARHLEDLTALANELRGLLLEYGITIPKAFIISFLLLENS